MRNKRAVGWLMVFAVLAVYLVCADRIALLFYDGQQMKLVGFVSFTSTVNGEACLDSFEKSSDLFDGYTFSGWAFCDTTQPNENKEISIVLKRDDSNECYTVAQKPSNRQDVYEAFHDTHSIVGQNHGVSIQFTTLSMEDGIYELYFHVKENADSSCLLNMNMCFEKKGRRLDICEKRE